MNVEPLLVAWLTPRYLSARVSTERPADLNGALPYVQIVGIGGSSDAYRFSLPRVDVDVFAATRAAARDLAEQIERDLLENLPGDSVNGVGVLQVSSSMSPTWTPDDNTNIRRFTLSIGLRLHDRSAA